jgi:septum formation protein
MKFLSILGNLEGKKIVLASQSPRRIELLKSVGLEFEIYPPKIDEQYRKDQNPLEYTRHIASEKAHGIARYLDYDLIIAADTVVTLENEIFEKPRDRREAEIMLRKLSNQTHQVITGFCLLSTHKVIIDHEKTDVIFYPLNDSDIEMYLNSDEPFDKAGAYGIQGFASIFIKEIRGCYFNVVGFPIGKFFQHIKNSNLFSSTK